ncbi:MAG: HlyC/CorC family transporter [Candidatus Krumholzibacteriota bacterium]|nr:HlyC/CorC family transporter [Candidatus Krumholzibacteriota bacterium]
MDPATLGFAAAVVATAVFTAAGAALLGLLRVQPQIRESEKKALLLRIQESWPQEMALVLVLVPFLSMTATLVLGTRRFAAVGGAGRLVPVWLGLTLVVLLIVMLMRRLAARHPASLTSGLGWLYLPLFFLLLPLSALLVRVLGRLQLARLLELSGPLLSAAEMRDFVEGHGSEELLQAEEREMISSIFDLRDTPVREVMIPRIDVKAIEVSTSLPEAREFVARVGHSRVPVYKESMDHVVGILYTKDLLRPGSRDSATTLTQLIRKPYYVPETKTTGDLLKRFQALHQHLAIVVDEYGGTAGIVTMEDVIEEIVGEIRDEYDKDELLFELIDDNSARVDAKIDLEELGEILGHEFEEVEEDFETLGGLLLYHSGRILRPGDELVLEPFTFRVESVQRQRIAKVVMIGEGLAEGVRAHRKPEPEEDTA